MEQPLKRLLILAVCWRILLTAFQVVVNICFEDFDTSASIDTKTFGAVQHPYGHGNNVSVMKKTRATNNWISLIFDGMNKWDSIYVVYITEHGYVYEQMMAFYPGFPYIVSTLSFLFSSENDHDNSNALTIKIFSYILNFIYFVFAICYLYKLTLKLSKNMKFSEISTLLFIINPATIFMMSSYTEAQFVFLQFGMLYYLEQKHFFIATIFIALSMLTRSNGIVNVAFLLYFSLKVMMIDNLKYITKERSVVIMVTFDSLSSLLRRTKFKLLNLFVSVVISMLPFCCYQIYLYNLYCTKLHKLTSKDHWCHWRIPFSYSYIQHNYWNVGLFRYYEFKQIPNFILASPVVYIIFTAVRDFCLYTDKESILAAFGLTDECKKDVTESNQCFIPHERLLVYLIHALFLTLSGLFAFHVQILTRMVCSSTPIFYWTCASITLNQLKTSKNVKYNFVSVFFLSYVFLGILLHSNFYPWT